MGKPQTSTSTLNAIRMKPSVIAVISVIDAVPDSFLRKRDLDIGVENGAVLPKKGGQALSRSPRAIARAVSCITNVRLFSYRKRYSAKPAAPVLARAAM